MRAAGEIAAAVSVMRRAGLSDVSLIAERPLTACFAGWHARTARRAFIKLLCADDEGVRRNFLREIEVLKSLPEGQGFPRLLESSIAPEAVFHACVHVEGEAFDRFVNRERPADLEAIVADALVLAQWLQRFHALGLAHRDLSPDHVIRGAEGVTVVDFGMTKRLEGMDAQRRALSLGYDLQAFGMILWEMICGAPVFSYRSRALEAEIPTQLAIVRSVGLPRALADVLEGCFVVASEMTPHGQAGRGDRAFGDAGDLVSALRPLTP